MTAYAKWKCAGSPSHEYGAVVGSTGAASCFVCGAALVEVEGSRITYEPLDPLPDLGV
jgi:hypothetical protein